MCILVLECPGMNNLKGSGDIYKLCLVHRWIKSISWIAGRVQRMGQGMKWRRKERGNVMLPAHKCCQMDKLEGQSISPVNADAIFTIPELFSLLLILCLARFINPVYTEKLDQSDMLTKCMSIYLHIHFSFFLTNFPTKSPNIWNVWVFFPPSLHS